LFNPLQLDVDPPDLKRVASIYRTGAFPIQINHLSGQQPRVRRGVLGADAGTNLRRESPQGKIFSWGFDLFDAARTLRQLGNTI
jgi:hypothetical protein